MALAETANLIVALKLDDRLSGPLGRISGRFSRLNVDTALLNQGIGKVGRGLGVGLRNSVLIGAAGVGALSTQVLAGVSSLRELESVNQQTIAGLESTGGVSGQTAQSIRDLSEEYEELGGVIDDKVIQAGQNVLLTFTNIREDAFEPAIAAALDLSTRMGTDLSSAALQVGKALNDPIRGLTALRRVGVQFSADQEAQIRALVEQNDLYGAQQIILAELNTEFGGSFAAQGRTNEATVARFRDAIEGLQQSLARGFLPVIDKVARKLTDLFSQQSTIDAVENFGNKLAGFFDEDRLNSIGDAAKSVFGYLAAVPWGTIGDGLRIVGQAAKVVIDAFNALPKEVQGIAIAALAANKLTGGLVASGIGDIGKALLGGAFGGRGTTPANPLFVSAVGGLGGGPGGTAGRGGGIGGAIGALGAAALGATIGREIGRNLFFDPAVKPTVEWEKSQFDQFLQRNSSDAAALVSGLDTIEGGIDEIVTSSFPGAAFLAQEQLDELGAQRQIILDQLAAQGYTTEEIEQLRYGQEQEAERQRGFDERLGSTADKLVVSENQLLDEARHNRAELAAKTQIIADRVSAMRAGVEAKMTRANELLGTVAGKDFAPVVKLDQTVNVSATLSASQAAAAIQIHNTITAQANKGNTP